MTPIHVGILGFGLATKVFHAPFVSAVPGLHLAAVVQRTGDEAALAYPATTILRSAAQLFADPTISLIVIATPNETHYDLAKQALLAGKNVVIDKPFAATSAEAAELITLAAARNLILAPFHNRRFDGDFLTVKQIIASGQLGRLVTFESHFDRYRPIPRENTWKEAEHPANGMLFDLGPHLVDQALALFGMPLSVTASVRTDRESSQIEDAFDICLAYPGLLAWCRTTYLASDYSARFLLHGTAGSFRKFGLDPQEPTILAGTPIPPLGTLMPNGDPWLQEPAAAWGTLTHAPNLHDPATLTTSTIPTEPGDYRLFYANVRDAIHGTAPLAIPTQAGHDVVRLLELARQSSKESRTLFL